MWQHILVTIYIIIAMVLSIQTKKLDVRASFTGGILAFIIYAGCGFVGISLLTTFFLLGTLATVWKFEKKQQLHLAEENHGRRTAGQVVANTGVAGLLGFLSLQLPNEARILTLMLAASYSSALSDTLSSEMGNLYGKTYYNILTLKRDIKGLNGVVSLEGGVFGLLGSVIIATVYIIFTGWQKEFWFIIVAGTIGNLFDSVLGASVERRGLVGNNAVNILNTAIAALGMFLLIQ
ncbi:MAG TPA: DUF92 domain-containing protein [Pedobacter sp.]|jgi:uncharacterized protein (TIGR00297 family)